MQFFKSPLFIVCSILFLLHQLLQHVFSINIALADAYLDNIMAMPIVLTILQAERQILFKRALAYQLPVLEVFLATLYIILISELIFPLLTTRFTSDWLDVVFFLAGAGIYLIVEYSLKNKKVLYYK
jgi:hypothetical protein